MKIIRYRDPLDRVHHACELPDGTALRLAGGIYGAYTVTTEVATVGKRLAPIEPSQIPCIGLNYRQHAAETGAKFRSDRSLS